MNTKDFEGVKVKINKLDKDVKKYIQDLQTERNLYKNCLGQIYFDIEHLKKDDYDYGEASEGLLSEIKKEIKCCIPFLP